MDKAFENEFKSFIGSIETDNIDKYKQKANQLAIMALTLQKFITLTLDEVEYAGFVGAEMLAKIEMFLRAVTPSYPNKAFQDILTTLEEIDPRFPKTRFYYGLNVLRSLCTGQGKGFLEIIQGKETATHNLQEMVFFTTFLIENIIKYIQYFRSSKLTTGISNQDFKANLEKRFEELVLRTVMSVTTSAKN